MREAVLLHELAFASAEARPEAVALSHGSASLDYAALVARAQCLTGGLLALQLARGQRMVLWLEMRPEFVLASLAVSAAGGVLVPVNPVLKPAQVMHILRDCQPHLLITSRQRWATLVALMAEQGVGPASLQHVVFVEGGPAVEACGLAGVALHDWGSVLDAPVAVARRVIDQDLCALFYTSGSTGDPKGVVLSHRNMVAGAKSVATYLDNRPTDTLLAALPLSFDAGFSQLTTAFHVGAKVVLLNYLLPRDVLKAMVKHQVTGLTAVPPLYIQLTQMDWPPEIDQHLRYFANTGGRMPRETLNALRQRAPSAKPFLMYGLTEAFRSTYLPPEEVDRRPDSIGKAIPNAEILVLREDGTECSPDEPGELVHRGALVGQGYWNDAEKTAERYKLLPVGVGGREAGLQLPEYAVFSGDTVRKDAEGFLYFIGRRDEMMKTSGYRVSPTEVEEVLYATRLLGECAAFGVDHPALGQAIQVVATPPTGADAVDVPALLVACKQHMPAYMVPQGVHVVPGPLPRNPNGKIDRKLLATQWLERQ